MKRGATKSDLAAKQIRAIEALCREPRIDQAAKIAGVTRQTLWRWLQQPDFSEAYKAARARLVEDALIRLEASASRAVSALNEVMDDKTGPPAARVSAARCALELLLRLRDSIELETRISAIEQRLQQTPRGIRR